MVTSSVATARSALLRQARRSTSTTVVPAYTNVVAGRAFSSVGSALLFLPQAEQPHRLQIRCFSTAQSSSVSDGLEVARSSTGGATEIVSKADMQQEETKRVRLSEVLVKEVLKAKHSHRWVDPVIHRNGTVREVITTVIEGGLSGMMVVDEDQTTTGHRKVVGLLTSRDLLRVMASGIKDGDSDKKIMERVVGEYMTPISQVVFARPEETVGMCRTLMAKLGIKCLPVLSNEGRVEGLITARDMSDFGLSAKDKGGKKAYLNDVSERVGLGSDTSMAEPPTYLQAHLALEQVPVFVNIGVAELPHPFKSVEGCASNLAEHGPRDPSTDTDLSEDAYFVVRAQLPDEKDSSDLRSVTYFGVADGVGSWREYGVDPRIFSHKLMQECENILVEATLQGNRKAQEQFGRKFRRVIAPAEIIAQAYERVKEENIIGSCTACVALFDSVRHQLHFSNLGDSGIIVLRHIDSDVAGSLKRDRHTPRMQRKSDLRVNFVSQQQLRSFNHPYQLGWTGEEINDKSASFKSPKDSCTTSIHIRRGDIVIMATDGLFDNVDIDDIATVALEWEQNNGFIRAGDIVARERRWKMGNSLTLVSAEGVTSLAEELCKKARENSLNASVDSPFAILAKENDIMWSGGMPDDCTVIVAHVVGQEADDLMDKQNQ